MDEQTFLNKLKKREPLFNTHPQVNYKRIMGTESELAVSDDFIEDSKMMRSLLFSHSTENGGRIYIDCDHIEFCTPEATNPVSWLAFYEGMKNYSFRRYQHLSHVMFAMNCDWEGNTHGHHENYFTCLLPTEWYKLIPYLITRTIFAGSGKWANKKFRLSQRSEYITRSMGDRSTEDRPIIHMKIQEPLSSVPGWKRIHLLCGDDTMCQFASLLKIGMTSLIIEMLEIEELPIIDYDLSQAEEDFKRVSNSMDNWTLKGVKNGPKEAIEILSKYTDKANSLFFGRDEITDVIIHSMRMVLKELGKNPMNLVGYLDWPTKIELLNTLAKKNRNKNDEWLASQEVGYHSLDPENSYYYWYLEDKGMIMRVVSSQFVEDAAINPPTDTRAYPVGKIVQWVQRKRLPVFVERDHWIQLIARKKNGKCILIADMPNPLEIYGDVINTFKKKMDGWL